MTGQPPGDREDGRRRSCVAKAKYDTRKDARKARKRFRAGGPLSIYSCPFCGFLHIGHLPPDVRRGGTPKDDWQRRTGVGKP